MIFYQKEQVVFHPKIYLFEGLNGIKLIIGSSNLTRGGLFTNVESSILFEFNTDDEEGQRLLSELKTYYRSIFDFSDPNLFKITRSLIDDFHTAGIIPDEATRRFVAKKHEIDVAIAENSGRTSVLTINIPKRNTTKAPSSFPLKPTGRVQQVFTTSTIAMSTIHQTNDDLQQKQLVWQKLSLSRSDAQVVNPKSNPTGNLKLSQALFKQTGVTIDQTTYFRHQLFNHLTWIKAKANSSTYEEAFCSFNLSILGNNLGAFILKLSHDSKRVAGQGNTPTWLHWGNNVVLFLQQNNITGKTLNLYRTNQVFIIEIV